MVSLILYVGKQVIAYINIFSVQGFKLFLLYIFTI